MVEPRTEGQPKGQGYWAATVGAIGGMAAGLLLGGAVASQVEGDPNAGLANIALIAVAILLTILGGAFGSVAGSYAGLRLLRHHAAFSTSLIMFLLLLPSAYAMLKLGVRAGLLLGVLALAPAARYVALNLREPVPRTSIAILILVAPFALSAFAFYRSPERQERARQSEVIQNIGFTVLSPSYVPEGFEEDVLSVPNGENPAERYVHLRYTNDQSQSFFFNQFEAWDRFTPPQDCGPRSPEDAETTLTYPCTEIFQTTAGDRVYAEVKGGTDSTYPGAGIYLQVGETMITLLAPYQLPQSEIQEVLNSLGPRSDTELDVHY